MAVSLSNRSLKARLVGAFAILGLLAVPAGLVSMSMLKSSSARLQAIAATEMPAAVQAIEVERALLNARIHFIYYLTTQRPGSEQAGREWLGKSGEALTRLESLNLEGELKRRSGSSGPRSQATARGWRMWSV